MVFGTLPYLAPEVLRGEPPREPSEVFSLGVIGLEMLTGALPWKQARSPSEVLAAHERELRIPSTPGWPATAVATLHAMLALEPSARPPASEVFLAMNP